MYIFYAGFFAILSKDDPFGLDGICEQEMVMMGCKHELWHHSRKQEGDGIPSSAKWISVSPCPEDSTIKNPARSQTLFPEGSNLPVNSRIDFPWFHTYPPTAYPGKPLVQA
jgi:hypothetical protein